MDLGVLRAEERVALTLRELYERYGYRQYKMSRFEEYRLYMENISFMASERVIAFSDADGRMLALKPDVTLSIVKRAAQTRAEEKVYYNESVYRPGRENSDFQEINQVGLERIGAIDGYVLGEVVALALKSLTVISPFHVLEMSHMGFAAGLMDETGIEGEAREDALRLLKAKNARELTERGWEKLARVTGLYGAPEETLDRAEALCENARMREAVENLRALNRTLSENNLSGRVCIDLSAVNNLDYYGGVIFRGYVEGLPREVLAGGQYDGLLEKFGRRDGGVGFAIYLNDVARLPSPRREFDCDALVLYDADADAAKLTATVERLASGGMRVRAERVMPEGIRCGRIYRFGEDGLKEGATC